MKGMKISYREVKRRQLEDFRTYPTQNLNNVYRYFSNIFTYMFVRLGITPNQITFIYFFCCILGAIFLAAGTYPSMLLGIFFFLLFKVLDDSDGEVARIQKSQSIEGVYLDRIGHYIYSLSLGMGLAIGIYRLYGNFSYLIIGMVFTFVIIIEHAIIDLLKSILRKKIIEESYSKPAKKERVHKAEMTRMLNEGYSFSEQSIFSKLFSVYPMQGLLVGEHFYTLIIGFLILLEYVLTVIGFQPVFSGIVIRIIPIYLLVISLYKVIWIMGFIHKLDKTRYITKF